MYKAKNLDAIIFDLGGVIINIDYQLTIYAFEALGVPNFQSIFSKEQQQVFSDQFERGEISVDQFMAEIRSKSGVGASDFMMKKAWNAMLLDIPKKRLELVGRLKKQIPCFVLSNTNYEHISKINDYMKVCYNSASLDPYFTKLYLSHEIGKRKPEKRSWQQILDENQLDDPNRVLFIDDSPQHIESAQKMGFLTHHLVNEDVTEIFSL